jgi:hypothetical protein
MHNALYEAHTTIYTSSPVSHPCFGSTTHSNLNHDREVATLSKLYTEESKYGGEGVLGLLHKVGPLHASTATRASCTCKIEAKGTTSSSNSKSSIMLARKQISLLKEIKDQLSFHHV